MPDKSSNKSHGNIHVGGNVFNSTFIIGNNNKVINSRPSEQFESIADAVINTEQILENVKNEHFVGRKWLVEKVDKFLNTNDRGVFIIEAPAGAGKTAFLAHLTQERSYIHHFIGLSPGETGISIGLRNLASQLIQKWKLEPYFLKGLLPSQSARPDFLQNILIKSAQLRDKTQPDKKIILLVDALDEGGIPFEQNVMGLPHTIPKGVFFIVSQRPGNIYFNTDANREVFKLVIEGPENLRDVRDFLEKIADKPTIKKILTENEYTPEQFKNILFEKSRGLWIYLHYVVNEIESGNRLPSDLSALPDGLTQYYLQYWTQWWKSDETKWHNSYLPLLALLIAEKESASLSLLSKWAGIDFALPSFRKLLEVEWRPFIIVSNDKEESHYRIYHATLREFFLGTFNQEKLNTLEKSWIGELHLAVKKANARIADYYITAWGGWDSDLNELIDNKLSREQDEKYGLMHLIAHLIDSEQSDKINSFLLKTKKYYYTIEVHGRGWAKFIQKLLNRKKTQSYYYEQNVWYLAHKLSANIEGYLSDIELAWKSDEQGYISNGSKQLLTHQIQYSLIRASINSHLTNVFPETLPLLIENNLWSIEQSKLYTNTIQEPEKRAYALIYSARFLSKESKLLFIQKAIEIAIKSPDPDYGTKIDRFSILAKALPELINLGQNKDVIQIIQSQKELEEKFGLYKHILNWMSNDEILAGIDLARSLHNILDRIQAFMLFLPATKEQVRQSLIKEILEIINLTKLETAEQSKNYIFHGIIVDEISLRILLENSSSKIPWLLLEVFFTAYPDLSHKVKTLGVLAPYFSEPSRNHLINKIIRESLPMFRLMDFDYFGIAFQISTDIEILLNLLPTAKRIEICTEILDYSKGPLSIKWWWKFLRNLNQKGMPNESLHDASSTKDFGLLLILEIVSKMFQGSEAIAIVKVERLIYLYKFYREVPAQFNRYETILIKEFNKISLENRISLLIKLMPQIKKDERRNAILSILQSLRQVSVKARQKEILKIIPWINDTESNTDQEIIELILELGLQIDDYKDQVWAYTGFISYMSENDRSRIIQQFFNAIHNLSERTQVWAIKRISPFLSEAHFQSAIILAKEASRSETVGPSNISVDNFYFSGNGLAELLCATPQEARRILIFEYAKKNLFSERKRQAFLTESAPCLPDQILDIALSEANMLTDSVSKAMTLTALLVHLPKQKQEIVFLHVEKLLSDVDIEIQTEDKKENIKQDNSENKTKDSINIGFDAEINYFSDFEKKEKRENFDRNRADIAVCLSNAGLIEQALKIIYIGNVHDGGWKSRLDTKSVQALMQIIPKVSPEQINQITGKKDLLNPQLGVTASAFVYFMTRREYQRAVELLDPSRLYSRGIRDPFLVNFLHPIKKVTEDPPDQLSSAWLLSIDWVIGWFKYSWYSPVDAAIICICKALPNELIPIVLEKINLQTNKNLKIIFLSNLIGRCPKNLRDEILESLIGLIKEYNSTFSNIYNDDSKSNQLVKHLSEYGLITEALRIANSIKKQGARNNSIVEIIKNVGNLNDISDSDLKNLVNSILSMSGNIYQMRGFEAIGKLIKQLPEEKIYRSWVIVWSQMRTCTRPDVLWHLQGLSPAIATISDEETFNEIYNSINDICSWWP